MPGSKLRPSIVEIKLEGDSSYRERCGKAVPVDDKHSVLTVVSPPKNDTERLPNIEIESLHTQRVFKRKSDATELLKSGSSTASREGPHSVAANKCSQRFAPVLTVRKKRGPQVLPNPTQPALSLSNEIRGSAHICTMQPKIHDKAKFKKPCEADVDFSRPKSRIGNCDQYYKELGRMSTTQLKFFLTQDPRKKGCLRNPDLLRYKPLTRPQKFETCLKQVKYADNFCIPDEKDADEQSINCVVVDMENPMNLDFQGLDYQSTYLRDEQDLINQQQYQHMARFMERKRLQAATTKIMEDKLQKERLAVPPMFHAKDWDPAPKPPSPAPSIHAAKLYRTTEKIYNARRLQEERERRRERYEDLYLRRKAKEDERKQSQEKARQNAEKYKGETLAMQKYENIILDMQKFMDEGRQSCEIAEIEKREQQQYPRNLRETRAYKKKIKIRRLIDRDIARTKKKFFKERTGQEKYFPDAELEYSSGSDVSEVHTLSTQTTDDEDEIQVGRKGSNFKVRGFFFRKEKIPGKRVQNVLTRQYGCKTRDEWLQQIIHKKRKLQLDTEGGLIHHGDPNDPNVHLFIPDLGIDFKKPKVSAVREYIQKRLGRHYDRTVFEQAKVIKPRLPYAVKRFNLISYMFGEDTNLRQLQKGDKQDLVQAREIKTTEQYLEHKKRLKDQRAQKIREKYMALLNLPCKKTIQTKMDSKCEFSGSESDSDWVPEKEPDILSSSAEYEYQKAARTETVPREMRGNMPAPEHRETTFRRNPHRPRDYEGLRVPSGIFAQTIQASHIPHLQKLKPDDIKATNVEDPKEAFTKTLKTRQHHEYWDPTQMKAVKVQYQPKVIKEEVSKPPKQKLKTPIHYFDDAEPICNAFINMDLTHPKMDIKQLWTEKEKSGMQTGKAEGKQLKQSKCQAIKDFYKHSRDPEELKLLDYPGRQEYLQFLRDIRTELYRGAKKVEESEKELRIDKDHLFNDLEEDLKSIESCLSSLDSSKCSNFTNDSGSLLLIEGKTKVPLDYIRKAVIPFEELKHSRFQLEQFEHKGDDNTNVFEVKPWKRTQDSSKKRDNFFTYTTRLYNGLRMRLEVPVPDVRKTVFGYAKRKYVGLVATDIDEFYIEAMTKNVSDTFGFKSDTNLPKEGLRLMYESLLVSGQIVRDKIWERLNEMHWINMQRTKGLIVALFNKLQKRSYDAAMAIMHEVKAYYDKTDELRIMCEECDTRKSVICTDLVFLEGGFSRLVMLQNFHYLLGSADWRDENDWIHRLEEDPSQLEPYDVSIKKRPFVNLRDREIVDDPIAISKWFLDEYLPNKHPLLDVFCDANAFLEGLEELKAKTFLMLLELHFTLGVAIECQQRLQTLNAFCKKELKEKEAYVERRCAKQHFMEDRAEEISKKTMWFCKEQLDSEVMLKSFLRARALIAEAWRRLIPPEERGVSDHDPPASRMAAMLSEALVSMLVAFEDFPKTEAMEVEKEVRYQRAFDMKMSFKAYQIERRIRGQLESCVKIFEPPYVKPPRRGKLPRLFLKKKVVKEIPTEHRMSTRTLFFLRAFNPDVDATTDSDIRDSIMIIDDVQQHIVPFYFDHFLRLNGYTPNYNFKTSAELRDGPEVERLRKEELVPEVLEKMKRWMEIKERVMNDNIKNNKNMYENINL